MRSRSARVLLWAGRPLMELRSTFRRAAVAWRSGRRPWLGLSLAASTGAADLLLHLPSTAGWVSDATALSAGLPIGQWLTRLPGSVLVPTPDLPLWLAMAQLTVVVGLDHRVCASYHLSEDTDIPCRLAALPAIAV